MDESIYLELSFVQLESFDEMGKSMSKDTLQQIQDRTIVHSPLIGKRLVYPTGCRFVDVVQCSIGSAFQIERSTCGSGHVDPSGAEVTAHGFTPATLGRFARGILRNAPPPLWSHGPTNFLHFLDVLDGIHLLDMGRVNRR